MHSFWKTLFLSSVAILALGLNSFAGNQTLSSHWQAKRGSMSEAAFTQAFMQEAVKADLQENTLARVYEAASHSDDPPMTAETRKVLSKGAYLMVASALSVHGIYLSEYAFTSKIEKLLDGMASLGLYPHALTVGYMGRYQAGIGMSLGTQFNFFIDKGELRMSSYSMFGGQIGAAAQAKVQFYAALCFGACYGGDAAGWYVGADASASLGAGVDGFFEFGVDTTDAFKQAFTPASKLEDHSYSIRDFYDAHAVYAGVGFDIGVGGGWTFDVIHYRLDFEKSLSKTDGNPQNIDPAVMTQFKLKGK
jgi:hypothetical protein